MINNSRETEQINIETERHDEIYLILAELKVGVDELRQKVDKYEPMFEYFNKGSIVAKALVALLKWSAGATITVGGMVGAYLAIKTFINGQN